MRSSLHNQGHHLGRNVFNKKILVGNCYSLSFLFYFNKLCFFFGLKLYSPSSFKRLSSSSVYRNRPKSASHQTLNLPLSNTIWQFLRFISPGRNSSHFWLAFMFWRVLSSHSPTPGAFKGGDERTRVQLLVSGSQLEPHKPMALWVWQAGCSLLLRGREIENASRNSFLSGDPWVALDVRNLTLVLCEERRSLKEPRAKACHLVGVFVPFSLVF